MAVFYEKAYDWSLATNDPYLLKQISAPTCQRCKEVIDGLTKLAAQGGHTWGARGHVDSSRLFDGKGVIKADHIVRVVVTQAAGGSVFPDRTTSDVPRATIESYIYISWIDGQWQIVGDFGA